MGDAVGRWEGDTLVIDIVGIKTNAFSAADMYGTPQSAAMHVIERYRLIDGARPLYATIHVIAMRRQPEGSLERPTEVIAAELRELG